MQCEIDSQICDTTNDDDYLDVTDAGNGENIYESIKDYQAEAARNALQVYKK